MAEAPASPEQLASIGMLAARLVLPGNRVGLGSGRAALAFVHQLGQRVRLESLPIVGVATSLATEQVARECGIPLATLETVQTLDIAVDGADEIDPRLDLLKGGGGNLLREKVIASIAKRFVIVAGAEKLVARLGEQFPVFVEVVAFAMPLIVHQLASAGAAVSARTNADGSLYLTDNANPLLHVRYADTAALADPAAADARLRAMPGVIATGIFSNMADEMIVARADGSVKRQSR